MIPLSPDSESCALSARRIEIGRVQPALECGADRWQLAVDDREPRSVAIRALDHQVLAKHALESESEARRGGLRGLVAVVAFPLEAAIAELVEHVARRQE